MRARPSTPRVRGHALHVPPAGGALSFIVGLVGVLNFFNAILTGILARKRELAVLQSIGMTGKTAEDHAGV